MLKTKIKRKRLCAAMLLVAMSVGMLAGKQCDVEAAKKDFSGVIWIAGDSISSDHSDNANNGDTRPLVGWGEVIGDYLDGVTVHNEARSGRSSKSYTKEKNYKTIMEEMGEGDVFFIQFGHNDENENIKLYTDPNAASDVEGSFKWYLSTQYIDPALDAGAYPVLCTPVIRYLVEGGKLQEQSHSPYAEAMKELAAEYAEKGIEIPVIDCHEFTTKLYEYDTQSAENYHAIAAKTEGGEQELDTTHYCEAGARNMALFVLSESCLQELSVASGVKIKYSNDAKDATCTFLKNCMAFEKEIFWGQLRDCDGKKGILAGDVLMMLKYLAGISDSCPEFGF